MKGSFDHFTLEGMTVLKPNHDAIGRLRDEGFIPREFGSRIWHASYVLIHYLSNLELSANRHIVELGCGWGLPAAYAKKRFGARVSATDADGQVENYQQLISRMNGVKVPFFRRSFTSMNRENLSNIDLLVGADICYTRTNAENLTALFQHHMEDGKSDIILADSGRSPFFHLVDKLRQVFSLTLHEVRIDLPTATSGYVLHIKAQ